MRILFISAFYPPLEIGGWDQLAQEMNAGLSARGHVCRVLCSSYGTERAMPVEDGVDRVLELEADQNHYDALDWLLRHESRQSFNLRLTREAIEEFRPDVAFVHVMWNLSRSVPWMAEHALPGRVVYYMADDWPYSPDIHTRFWRQPSQGGLRRLPKKAIGWLALQTVHQEQSRFPLQFRHVLCVSNTVRKNLARFAGIPDEQMRVVYNGIDLDRFSGQRGADRSSSEGRLALLYAGNLVTHKGVRTAIEAMALLAGRGDASRLTLDVVGSGHPDYEAELATLVEAAHLGERVRFRGRVPREAMPSLMAGHDVLVFPSTGPEALPRMVLEAMAAGLIVVGTTTGGTAEVLVNGETGLTFDPGDASGLARQVERLMDEPELRPGLAERGRALALRDFDIRTAIDEIERELSNVAKSGAGAVRLAPSLSSVQSSSYTGAWSVSK